MKIEITPELVEQYCNLIGDDNPIHDPDNTVKYGQPVAPGILVTALITRQDSMGKEKLHLEVDENGIQLKTK